MRSIAILDAGPLYAAADAGDLNHATSLQVLSRRDLDLVIPALVLTEVTQLIERRMGATAEAAFLRGLVGFAIEPPAVEDWPRIADLVDRYADFPLGTVDASIAVLADRLGTDLVVTLDRRHFGTVRSPAGQRFRLLPEVVMAHEDLAPYPEPER